MVDATWIVEKGGSSAFIAFWKMDAKFCYTNKQTKKQTNNE